MFAKKSNRFRFAKEGEKVLVDPSLAMTPAQMDRMRMQGLPISNQNLVNDYFDGLPPDKCSFSVPIDEMRGVDMVEVWTAQKDARKVATKVSQVQKQLGSK